MNKQEVIKYLEKKREAALDNSEYYRDKENEKYEKMNRARVDSYTIAIQAVEKMEGPEKVEVTEEQAELLRAFKGESIFELLANCLREDEELMAKAHLYGYTVKPTQWVVKFGSNLAYYFNGWYTDASIRPNGHSNKGDSSVIVFNDKSKAEAVATLVEGSVEEID